MRQRRSASFGASSSARLYEICRLLGATEAAQHTRASRVLKVVIRVRCRPARLFRATPRRNTQGQPIDRKPTQPAAGSSRTTTSGLRRRYARTGRRRRRPARARQPRSSSPRFKHARSVVLNSRPTGTLCARSVEPWCSVTGAPQINERSSARTAGRYRATSARDPALNDAVQAHSPAVSSRTHMPTWARRSARLDAT
jgi:hypothetical protein